MNCFLNYPFIQKIKTIRLLLAFLLLTNYTGNAQNKTQHLLTPEILAQISGISYPKFSPDGKWIAFEEQKPLTLNKIEMNNKDIWIVPVNKNSKPRKIAFGPNIEFQPQWSPNGEFFSFLSNRENPEIFQLYLLPCNGGEAQKITSLTQGIISYQWLPDGQTIAFLAPISSDLPQKHQADIYIVGHSFQRIGLYELNLNTHTIKRITQKNENVNSFKYSHSGNQIALNLSDTPNEDNVLFHSRLVIMNRDGSARKTIQVKEGEFNLGAIRWTPYWSPDDQWLIYFIRAASSYLPVLLSTKTFHPQLLTKNYKGTIWYMNWSPTNKIIVAGNEGVQVIIGELDPNKDIVKIIKKVGTPYCEAPIFDISPDGKQIAFHGGSYKHPDDIWIMNSDGSNLRRLTHMNAFIDSLTTFPPEIIHWKSKDGLVIEGLLFKPTNYDSSKQYPTIINLHGGPTWAWWNGWLAGWHEWGQFLTNYGFVVLMPNPRGSNGYGYEFSKTNFNDWGGGDFDDIMSGIDFLIQKGIADSSRLGIGGWSYGGFLTAWTITQTNRFKAAVMGASVTDLITMHNTCGRPENFKLFFGGGPLTKNRIYRMHSPVTFVKNVKTPTLILHGEKDTIVPITQSYEFYQALKDLNVETTFVVYPREGHAIDEMAHQIDLMHRLIDWFSFYLK